MFLRRLFEYAQIVVGCALSGVAVNIFVVPHHLASGGVGGLLLIAHYVWGSPIGIVYAVANVPLVIWLWRLSGWEGLAKTIVGIAAYSIFVDATTGLANLHYAHDPLLATVYAGVLSGIGGGLVYRTGATSGGTSVLGRIVRHYTGMEIGRFLFLTDLFVMGLAGVILRSPEVTLYSWVMTYVSSRLTDNILEGVLRSKAITIITDQGETVAAAIMEQLHRGVTVLAAEGAYSGERRQMLVCVVAPNELLRLRSAITEVDPDVFFFVTDAHEVAGRGFTMDSTHRRVPFWVQRG